MKTLTRKEARAAGFKSISMNVTVDSDTYKSMALSMKNIDACWIETGEYTVQLARKLTTVSGKKPAKYN